ncbi:hypothetical protein OH492_19865 [Vibrio chagasii]|nr:hypothetical protein [Vibrio chagasii]
MWHSYKKVKKSPKQESRYPPKLRLPWFGNTATCFLFIRSDESVQKFTKDVGASSSQKGGVLDKHNNYLQAKQALYVNIANLAVEVDQAMAVLDSFNVTAEEQLQPHCVDASSIYDKGLFNAITSVWL